MSYTLAAAAAACGLNKSTVLRAIKAGKISGTKDEHGKWHIEAAELHRVYPPVAAAAHGMQTQPSISGMRADGKSSRQRVDQNLHGVLRAHRARDRRDDSNSDRRMGARPPPYVAGEERKGAIAVPTSVLHCGTGTLQCNARTSSGVPPAYVGETAITQKISPGRTSSHSRYSLLACPATVI